MRTFRCSRQRGCIGLRACHGRAPRRIQFRRASLCRTLPLTELAGTLVVIPVANPAALAAWRRRVPIDGADLNRIFPGQADGSFSERLAAGVFGLVQGADFLFSLHSWSAEGDVAPYLEFPGGDDAVARRSLAVGR